VRTLRVVTAALPALLISPAAQADPSATRPAHTQDILSYRVALEPSLDRPWVRGREAIRFDPRSLGDGVLVFSANTLAILRVRINGRAAEAHKEGERLIIEAPSAFARKKTATLEIEFEGAPARGYSVSGGAIVTTYFACDWMICAQEDFGDKATMALDLVLPRRMETIGPGVLAAAGTRRDGKFHALWTDERPRSAYLYAFAVGPFNSATEKRDGVTLRYMSAGASPEELRRLFAPTGDMLEFFAGKAGVPFPGAAYTELLVDGEEAQEAASHSVIGREDLDPMLADPSEDWVIAHELAHQWWGNAITCTDLSQFWLNEGVTVFMTAAWKEHRWGRAAYNREMDIARKRVAAAAEAGVDVPLTYSGPYPSLRLRRAIQYSKGALFVDALRRELGEEAFWRGFADYTRANMGGVVTSRDFQAAMERASGRDLSALFNAWVYEAPPPSPLPASAAPSR
jgi:aminopeptidase N